MLESKYVTTVDESKTNGHKSYDVILYNGEVLGFASLYMTDFLSTYYLHIQYNDFENDKNNYNGKLEDL